MNELIENLSSIKDNGLEIEVSRIEDILVFQNEFFFPLPMKSEWLTKNVKTPADLKKIAKNYQEISGYLFEMEIIDRAWFFKLHRFLSDDNMNASKKCMEYILSLDNPLDYGWIGFLLLCDKNGEKELKVDVLKKMYKLYRTPEYATLLIRELNDFGREAEATKIIDELLQMPVSDFNKNAVLLSPNIAWNLLLSGKFFEGKTLIQKIIEKEEDFHLFINLAHCFMMEYNKYEALKYYRKAKKMNEGSILDDFDADRKSIRQWITNSELWDSVRKELE